MDINLPKRKNTPDEIVLREVTSIVVIGGNGSGKTRFGSRLEENYSIEVHRISAQKSLSMPSEVSPKSKEKAEQEFWYGGIHDNKDWLKTIGKKNYRWGNNLNTFLLNDYEKLMVLLHTEEYEESLKYKEGLIEKPVTKLDRIQKIWEETLPHRKIIKRAGIIETYPKDKPEDSYNASEMSDGERVIFYLIGEVVCAKPASLLIIDEPEMHIHKSITKKLWDAIEKERPDCTFIYLTHDIDFAVSRQNATRIWSKSYEGNQIWDYEILDKESPIPEQVYLEILGSRNPILFIEGDNSSIDFKIFEQVFPEYTTKPLGSCSKVFEATKSFNELNTFHHIESFGLIDRDRRTDEEIEYIRASGIWICKLAEVENLLLIENVVKTVAESMHKNPDEVFNQVKSNIVEFFRTQIELQATQHSISTVERVFKYATNQKDTKTFDELDTQLSRFWSELDYASIYEKAKKSFEDFVSTKNYLAILEVFNNKGLMANSKVSELCDLNTKNNAYLNFVISLLKENSEKSLRIKNAVKEMIEK